MKATGVVRRLDQLGRLVIPKEIRKRFQIKEGDSIEFYILDDKIMIQKFEPLSEYLKDIKIMCDILEQLTNHSVFFVTDQYLNQCQKNVKKEFITMCQESYRITQFKDRVVYQDNKLKSGVICPLSSYGEWMGAFVIVGELSSISQIEMETVKAFTQLLIKKQDN